MSRARALRRGFRPLLASTEFYARMPWRLLVCRSALALGALVAAMALIAVALAQILDLGEGELLFETSREGNWDVFRLDLATGRLFNITGSEADEQGAGWSPDGKRIVFSADVERDLRPEIYLMDANGANEHYLVSNDGSNRRPSWSPDGRSVVFMHNYRRIRLIDLATGFEEDIAGGFGPTWSPDGRYLAFYDDPDGRLNSDIFVLDQTMKRLYNLTRHPANDWGPAWSPDGRWIAFASARGGSTDIYLMDASCLAQPAGPNSCPSSIQRLTNDPGSEYDPAWSPDSRRVAYVSERSGQFQLRVIRLDGSGDRVLITGAGINQYPRWRPG